MQEKTPHRLIKRREVLASTGLAVSTLYERISAGTFPRPVALGPRSVAWSESEVQTWIAERIAEPRRGTAPADHHLRGKRTSKPTPTATA